jgi:chromosome partitioning protein
MAKIFCVANQKGGVGKTTTTVNLAAGLAKVGQRVLMIDLDPQGNATMGSGVDKRKLPLSVYDVLLESASIREAAVLSEKCGYRVLGANRELAGAEVELVGLERREKRLKSALAEVADDHDFVLIDCPPSLSLLTLNGLCAAHGVVVPMQCEYFALEGLSDLVNTIRRVHANLNRELEIIGLLRVMFDPRITLQQQVSDQLKDALRRQGVQHPHPAQRAPGRGAQLWPARRGIRPVGQGQPGLCGVRPRDGDPFGPSGRPPGIKKSSRSG